MALQGTFETQTGITATEAYAKISQVHVDYYSSTGSITIKIFYNKEARDTGKSEIGEKTYFFSKETTTDPDTNEEVVKDNFTPIFTPEDNSIANVYNYLKTTDFEGWVDV